MQDVVQGPLSYFKVCQKTYKPNANFNRNVANTVDCLDKLKPGREPQSYCLSKANQDPAESVLAFFFFFLEYVCVPLATNAVLGSIFIIEADLKR